MERKSVEINGIRMQWDEHGTGQPVIFLHGVPTCPRLWRHVIPRVVGARSLAWEMVGYGASIPESQSNPTAVACQAEYLASWMRALALGPAVLVGHDLGGGIAQIVAVRYPELVAGLVLTNCISYDSWPIPSVKVLQALSPIVAHLPAVAIFLILSLLALRGHDDRSRARESLPEHWAQYARASGAKAFVRQIRPLDVHDTLAISPQLPHINLPARLVWGADDQFLKIGYGYRLAYDLRAPLDRIEGGKHFVPEDHPDRVALAVNQVLLQVAARGSENDG